MVGLGDMMFIWEMTNWRHVNEMSQSRGEEEEKEEEEKMKKIRAV